MTHATAAAVHEIPRVVVVMASTSAQGQGPKPPVRSLTHWVRQIDLPPLVAFTL
jgi:hypothetical protein